jgi:hypothetical protein
MVAANMTPLWHGNWTATMCKYVHAIRNPEKLREPPGNSKTLKSFWFQEYSFPSFRRGFDSLHPLQHFHFAGNSIDFSVQFWAGDA